MSKMEASDRPESQLSSSSWAERKMDHWSVCFVA
jgi:hypothetical protein